MMAALTAGGAAFWIAAALTADADDLDEANFEIAAIAGAALMFVVFFYLLHVADGPKKIGYIPPGGDDEEERIGLR